MARWTLPAPDFSAATIRDRYPEQYHRWVAVVLALSMLGYGLSTLVKISEQGAWPILTGHTDPWVVVLDALGVAFLLRGRTLAAATIVLAAAWLDIHITYLVFGDVRLPTGLILPAFLLCVGLLVSGRIAQLTAATLMFSVPLCVDLSAALGWGPGVRPEDTVYFVTLEVVIGATWAIMATFLHSFGLVLRDGKTNESRARDLIENAPDAILALSTSGRIETFNHTAERLLGISKRNAIGMSYLDLPFETDDLKSDLAASGPIRLRVRDGSAWLEARLRHTTQEDGSAGVLIVLRDITDRRRAEERAQSLRAQLLHTQKLDAVGQLAGGIAHDFNNLLTAVGGFGELLQRSSDTRAREYGTQLMATSERGADLIRQLLTFARKEPIEPRAIDIADAVTGMRVLLERILGEAIHLVVEAPGACVILADPGQLEQVLLNLASNAKDAMPRGGTVTLSVVSQGDRVVLRFQDDGAGIPPEVRPHLFEPFFTTKARTKGTGLGLATVHGIVTEAGGSIEVESEPGKGTTFILNWPRSSLEVASVSARAKASHVEGAGRTVLVVEDNTGARAYLERLLEGAGFHVLGARDGQHGLEVALAGGRPPDLLLADVVMPGMTGPALLAELQRRWPGLPYLFTSGYLGESEHELGADSRYLIRKPFTAEHLLVRISERLGDEGQQQATTAQDESAAK